MSKADFVLTDTTTTSGSGKLRVHRATCKRVNGGLAPTLDAVPDERLALADIASCCKPKAARVYIDEAVANTKEPAPVKRGPSRETVKRAAAQVQAELTAVAPAIAKVLEDSEAKLGVATVPLPTMYRRAMGRGSDAFSQVFGYRLGIDLKAKTVTVEVGDVETLASAWEAAYAAVCAWRKADPDYSSIDRSNRKEAHRVYLLAEEYVVTFLKGYADQLADAPMPQQPAPAYLAGRDAAEAVQASQDVI